MVTPATSSTSPWLNGCSCGTSRPLSRMRRPLSVGLTRYPSDRLLMVAAAFGANQPVKNHRVILSADKRFRLRQTIVRLRGPPR